MSARRGPDAGLVAGAGVAAAGADPGCQRPSWASRGPARGGPRRAQPHLRAPPGARTGLGRLRGLAHRAASCRWSRPQLASVPASPSAAHPPASSPLLRDQARPGGHPGAASLLSAEGFGELSRPGSRNVWAAAARRRGKRSPERGRRGSGTEASMGASAPVTRLPLPQPPPPGSRSAPSSAAPAREAPPRPPLPQGRPSRCPRGDPAAAPAPFAAPDPPVSRPRGGVPTSAAGRRPC
ncbi:uncharacterized protein LOC114676918 [Macaca mulatta]